MCHSYDYYSTGLAKRDAEHRLGPTDFHAAEPERRLAVWLEKALRQALARVFALFPMQRRGRRADEA